MSTDTQQDTTVAPSQDVQSASRATMADVADIIKHPASYGVQFVGKPINRGTGNDKTILRKDAPRVEVTDLDLFVRRFGEDVTLDAINGTSVYIKAENMVRALIVKDRTISNDACTVEIVKRVLLATPAPRGGVVKKFVAADGTEHATLLDAQRHMVAKLTAAGIDIETAKKMLGIG